MPPASAGPPAGRMLDEARREATEESVMAPLLPFHREMVQQLLDDDGLCVMSAGLGWQKVIEKDLCSGRR